MRRLLLRYLTMLIVVALAGIALYAMFADLPAPKRGVILDVEIPADR
ncbi:MAG: hypothetical protein AAGE18_16425 [Pseudomonadota bacterium]